jgi:hypothetical protein
MTKEDMERVEQFQRMVLRAFMSDFLDGNSTVSLAQLNARVRARTIVVIEGKRIPWDEYVRQNRKGPKQLKLL